MPPSGTRSSWWRTTSALADCSIVVAPYTVEGEPGGTIGVLGPTRMNYPQALAAVAVVIGVRLLRRPPRTATTVALSVTPWPNCGLDGLVVQVGDSIVMLVDAWLTVCVSADAVLLFW